MDFQLDQATLDLKAQAREWVHGTLDGLCAGMEDEEKLPEPLVGELRPGRMRFFCLPIPTESGGEGGRARLDRGEAPRQKKGGQKKLG